MKHKRKPLHARPWFWIALLSVLLLLGLTYGALAAGFLQVSEVRVVGTERVSGDAIRDVAERHLSHNLILFTSRSIVLQPTRRIKEDILATFPQINDVRVGRALFDAIEVKVVERHEVARYCRDICYFVDASGVVFQEAAEGSQLPRVHDVAHREGTVTLSEQVVDAGIMEQLLRFVVGVNAMPDITVVAVDIETDNRLNIRMHEGWQAFFDMTDDVDMQIRNLRLVLTEQLAHRDRTSLEYIDLRFGDRVYFKHTGGVPVELPSEDPPADETVETTEASLVE